MEIKIEDEGLMELQATISRLKHHTDRMLAAEK